MNFKIAFIALFATAGTVAEPAVLRGVKELHEGVELPGSSQPRPTTLAGKISKTKCSGRGRVVTVTNTHTVTAAMQQAAPPTSISSSIAVIKNTTSISSKVPSTVSTTRSSGRAKSDSTVASSTSSALASSKTLTWIEETASIDNQRSTSSSVSGSNVIIRETNSLVFAASTSSATGSSSIAAVTSTSTSFLDSKKSSTTFATRISTAVVNKETSSSSSGSTLATGASSRTIGNNSTTASIEFRGSTTAPALSSVAAADKTLLVSSSSSTITGAAVKTESSSAKPPTTGSPTSILSVNPTDPVPVSRAGDTLNPSAAAEAHEFDDTATRPLESVNIKSSDGRCLSIDPTAGDFRQNLIPVSLAECSEAPNQKFDVVTRGKHNDGKAGEALLVSVLTNGCISFDGRRQAGDTVTLFSCGGRAAGDGKTDVAQLYPFDETDSIVLSPASGNGNTCLIAGVERLESASCTKGSDRIFQLVEVL